MKSCQLILELQGPGNGVRLVLWVFSIKVPDELPCPLFNGYYHYRWDDQTPSNSDEIESIFISWRVSHRRVSDCETPVRFVKVISSALIGFILVILCLLLAYEELVD